MELDESQAAATRDILSWEKKAKAGDWFALGGIAGSGKTSVVSEFVLPEVVQKKRVVVVTPTARAARVLANRIPTEVKRELRHLGTIHSLIYKPILRPDGSVEKWVRRHSLEELADLVVVDECSMVDHKIEADLLSLGAPVLAVGDYAQLPPIEGISTWMERPTVRLGRAHRQALESPVLRLATYVRERQRLPLALDDYEVEEHFKLKFAVPAILDRYEEFGRDNVAIACHTNRNRHEVNQVIHDRLFDTETPCKGAQVVCLKNNHYFRIYNGDRGHLTSEPVEKEEYHYADINLDFGDKCSRVKFNTEFFGGVTKIETQLKDEVVLDFGYALTAHKMQGSSFHEVFVVKDIRRENEDYARWMYTAITRAVSKVHLIHRM